MRVLNELREKYTYNITPFSAPASLQQIRPMTKKHKRDDARDVIEPNNKSGTLIKLILYLNLVLFQKLISIYIYKLKLLCGQLQRLR